jgi:hypothetical protein
MRAQQRIFSMMLALALLIPQAALSQGNFKEIEARVAEYKKWLDQVGSNGSRYWVRLDSSKRPHRLFVAEGFMGADNREKEQFIEIFSRYLAGHPEKNMLIDIYDAASGKVIGEYGFGGFKLFSTSALQK